MTFVIALAGSKGGVGKSTLAAALAARATRESDRVAFIDAEPQQSLTLWWRLRGKPNNPRCHTDSGDTAADVEALKRGGAEWIIIDTPPLDMDRIEAAIVAADFVLVPARPSVFDLHGTQAVAGLCQEHRKRFAFVLNAVDTVDPAWKGIIRSMTSGLKKLGPLLPKTIRVRAAYVSTLNAGLSGPEHPDARQAAGPKAEVEALWLAIKRRTGKAKGR